ncbi:MAG: hypothetical protein ACFB0B_19415 [Thermonemataceae bacterium]|mgnify:CR=1 FL=1
MQWNEKIDLLKKTHDAKAFSTSLMDRKNILREIETKFIARPAQYYTGQESRVRFSDWWSYIKSPAVRSLSTSASLLLEKILKPQESYWIACEFSTSIKLYKAEVKALTDLIAIGQTWTNTYHIVQPKYKYLIALMILKNKVDLKLVEAPKEILHKIDAIVSK